MPAACTLPYRAAMFKAGDVVAARGERWTIEDATGFEGCTLLRLSAADPRNGRIVRRLLHPFDRPVVSRATPVLRAVTRRRWMHHLQTCLGDLRRFGQLRAAALARMDLLPFQLEPALALVRGRATRFLLADEVGLGKTVQAGLMIAELEHRGWCDRALILAPAGLRQQWADELDRRFSVRAAIVDAASLAALSRTLPAGVNPWAVERVIIASIDFVKQPEVLGALNFLPWDIVIVDEAHQAATAPLRAAAVAALAERARHVVLLTATPHAGDDAAYRSLCGIGEEGPTDPILLFRRSRHQAGLSRDRRVHLLPVRLCAAELEMHALLAGYVSAVWHAASSAPAPKSDLRLVAMMLGKRAFSSAASLAISIEKRLSSLSGDLPVPLQSSLPFDLDDDASDDASIVAGAAFDSVADEQDALRRILAAAKTARTDERKMGALRRLLRRIHEPAIVFTEYRDTLATIDQLARGIRRPVLLHGGLTVGERHAAVEAFTEGAADLLLATDAGAEGLNLHRRCRLVINLELPWNPLRLEQRIGRVDRLGQPRTVHAIHLLAEGTAERAVLARLVGRLDRIRCSEIDIAASILTRAPAAIEHARGEPACTRSIDLRREAETEASRLRAVRAIPFRHESPTGDVMPVTLSRTSVHFAASCVVCFCLVSFADGGGRRIEEIIVPVSVDAKALFDKDVAPTFRSVRRRRDIRHFAEMFVQRFGETVVSVAAGEATNRFRDIQSECRAQCRRALQRERHVAGVIGRGPFGLVQAGLFDNRSLKHDEALKQRQRLAMQESAVRTRALEQHAAIAMTTRIVAVLVTGRLPT